MLITKQLSVRVGNLLKYYKNLGYFINSRNSIISIKIEDLPKFSNLKIEAQCDICQRRKILKYSSYSINIEKYNLYTCSNKCATIKNKKTNLKLYGVESALKSDYFKNKLKEYFNTKYGMHPSKLKETKEKIRKTSLTKYGYSTNLIIPEKLKIAVELSQTKEVKLKRNDTVYKKYNVDNVFKNINIKNKIKNTNLKKYGFIHPMKNDDIKKKFIASFMEKYGVSNPMKLEIFIQKGLDSRNKNKTPEEIKEIKEIFYYVKEVRKLSYKNIKKLLKNWDGFDYYDGEYILDYYNLNANDPKYPNIDHKISIFYGFKNNIPVTYIASLENLCVTKRIINLKKSKLNEGEFKKLL